MRGRFAGLRPSTPSSSGWRTMWSSSASLRLSLYSAPSTTKEPGGRVTPSSSRGPVVLETFAPAARSLFTAVKPSFSLQSIAYPCSDSPGRSPSGQIGSVTLSVLPPAQRSTGSTLTPMNSAMVSVAESWGLRGLPSLPRVHVLSG